MSDQMENNIDTSKTLDFENMDINTNLSDVAALIEGNNDPTEGNTNPTETNPTGTTLETMLDQKLEMKDVRPILRALSKSKNPEDWNTVITKFKEKIKEGEKDLLHKAAYTDYQQTSEKTITPIDLKDIPHNDISLIIQAAQQCKEALENNNGEFQQFLSHYENLIGTSDTEAKKDYQEQHNRTQENINNGTDNLASLKNKEC